MTHGKLDWREFFTDAFAKCGRAADEKRNIGAEFQAERGKLVYGRIEIPELVQRDERRRRVGTPTAQSTADRNAFANFDIDADIESTEVAQQIRRPNCQVFVRGNVVETADADDLIVRTSPNANGVAPIQNLKNGL